MNFYFYNYWILKILKFYDLNLKHFRDKSSKKSTTHMQSLSLQILKFFVSNEFMINKNILLYLI